MPSSVVIFRNELTRQPASQCRSSTLTIFIGILLDNANHVIRQPPIIPDCCLWRRRPLGPVGAAGGTVAPGRPNGLRARDHPTRRVAVARGNEQHQNPKPDIEIAQAAAMRPIGDVAAAKLGIPADAVLPYGKYKAKISFDYIRSLCDRPNGKLILVTAITPTPAGEGKTTTTVGLGDALNH